MYACLYILEIWNVKLYDYPELILIFYRLVTFKNLLNTLPSQHVKQLNTLQSSGLGGPAVALSHTFTNETIKFIYYLL